MSGIDIIIQNSMIDKSSELIITDTSWRILYRNNAIDFKDEQWDKWVRMYRDEPVDGSGIEWEIADREESRYYKVKSHADFYRDEMSIVHHVYDVSDYAELFRELSEYSNEWRRMSACQTEMIESLSDDPCGCLRSAVKYYRAEYAVLYVERRSSTYRYILQSGKERIEGAPSHDAEYMHDEGTYYVMPGLGDEELLCCCSGTTVTNAGYGLYVRVTDRNDRLYSMLYSQFKLYIENALLREQIVYENTHDMLTGLYNRSRYNEMTKTEYQCCDSIAVYNLDLNYLKRTNDTYGHETGNRLLLNAARSILDITSDNVHGYRMGGDEFLIIAVNVSEDEYMDIRRSWDDSLAAVNSEGNGPECVVACGMKWAKAPYDLKQLLEETDGLMYEDKRAIKLARGDDPDAR